MSGELKINFVIKAWLARTFQTDVNEECNGDHDHVNQIDKEFDEAEEKSNIIQITMTRKAHDGFKMNFVIQLRVL